MAKAKEAEVTEVAETVTEAADTNLPAVGGDFQLPAGFAEELADIGDLGYSEKAEDSMIPILAILQDNSGEVKNRHSKRIEGAMAGDLIIRSLQRVIAMSTDDAEPIIFQPCAFQHMWVEWQGETGEGVPVAQYPFEDRPADTREVPDPENPDRIMLIRPNGNRLVDTRYHFGFVLSDEGDMPLVIPMAGTNHTVSRQWTATMKQFRLPNGTKAPAFFRRYAINTKYRERGPQSWYNYDVKDLGWITDEGRLRQGLELLKSVKDDKVSAAVGEMEDGGGSDVVDPDQLPI